MWHWDQGRLAYFQFDALKKIAQFVCGNDFKSADRTVLVSTTGLPFSPADYTPWRNYSRVLKLSLLVSEENGIAKPTPIAQLLAKPGTTTCDEYLHFIAQVFTEPSPALKDWKANSEFRYPLLFSLKYLLANVAGGFSASIELDEIIGAYKFSEFVGDETDEDFIQLINKRAQYSNEAENVPDTLMRQARESLKVLSQISYLHYENAGITISLAKDDAREIFQELNPISGDRESDSDAEIRRLAEFFKEGSTQEIFDYSHTKVSEVVDSGFKEGSKIKKTHVTIERNSKLRDMFFKTNATTICDLCSTDTIKSYPWTERVLDIHHLLPLSSGTRTEAKGTTLNDLVALCPTCHRATHRYYEQWLKKNNQLDFNSAEEAVRVYNSIKEIFSKEGKDV